METLTQKPYDRRTPVEVLRALRAAGVPAYPNAPMKFLDLPIARGDGWFAPLGNHQKAKIVVCNESGTYFIVDSDRYGFTNPDGVYGAPVQIAAIGDSFTQGACVPDNAMALIRREVPQLLNFGIGGTGPGLQYAVFKEYVAKIKPRIVLWIYFENDLTNLLWEDNNAFVRSYHETGRTQNLIERQAEVDKVIEAFMAAKFDAVPADWQTRKTWWTNFLLLRDLRSRLRLNFNGPDIPDHLDPANLRATLPLFRRLLADVRASAQGWGGNVVFVYLPEMARFVHDGRGRGRADYLLRDEVLAMVRQLDIPVVDLLPAFARSADPLGDFYFYAGSHYNHKGYRLVADAILAYLRANGLQPAKARE